MGASMPRKAWIAYDCIKPLPCPRANPPLDFAVQGPKTRRAVLVLLDIRLLLL